MQLNADQKDCVKSFLRSIDIKSLLENEPDEFEEYDWDEAWEAIDEYLTELLGCV